MLWPRSLGNAGIALATVALLPVSRMISPGAMPVRLMSAGSRRARPRLTSFARASVALRTRSQATTVSVTAPLSSVITASLRRLCDSANCRALAAYRGCVMSVLNRGAFALPRRGVEQIPQVEPQGGILVLQTKMGLEFVHTLLQPQQRQSQALDVVFS